jgi:hypothetical protein
MVVENLTKSTINGIQFSYAFIPDCRSHEITFTGRPSKMLQQHSQKKVSKLKKKPCRKTWYLRIDLTVTGEHLKAFTTISKTKSVSWATQVISTIFIMLQFDLVSVRRTWIVSRAL